jgi:hypothetical protein
MGFTLKQQFLRFSSVWIGNATIDRTNSRALWFLVESHALGTFVGHYIIYVVRYRGSAFVGLVRLASTIGKMAPNARTVCIGPINPTLVDGVVGAFRLTGSAVDAFIGNDYGHPVFGGLAVQNSCSFQFNQPSINKNEVNL